MKRTEVRCVDPVPRLRVTKWRVALVRDGSIPTAWDKTVRDPGDVARLMAPLVADLDREYFWSLALDGKNRASSLHVVSIGSLTAALVHPRELFVAAILAKAASIVLVHNHPSGDPTPSCEDISLSRRLSEVGDLVGIKVLDHIVMGEGGSFRSLADEGHLGDAR